MIVAPATFIDIVRDRAIRQWDRHACTFLVDGETEGPALTYGELDRQARAIAALLADAGAAGERVLLLYPAGSEFVSAFLGCLYAGAVAVPAYPPHPARLERSMGRLLGIASDARPLLALTTSAALAQFQRLTIASPEWHAMRVLATDDLERSLADTWRESDVRSDHPAILQYTSGSTGRPRGVVVTHGNLLHNSARIQHQMRASETSQLVTWLPQYHDMGLIGGVLQPLYTGFPVVLMSPFAFLQRPLRWMMAMSRYQATVGGGPNFAYELCAARITDEQVRELDLRHWDVAFNGAEPVRADTLERFAAKFAPAGFRRASFFPCYGLAEATLMVSGPGCREEPRVVPVAADALEHHRVEPVAASDPRARPLVGCGVSIPDQRIVIVDPASGARRSHGEIGEIFVAGPSIAQGYWRRTSESEQTFAAVAGDGDGPFLRTGDLGFLDHDGTLFVTGRIKDLIIIRGQNHYPHDIEATVAASHPLIRPGGCAAFAVDAEGEERLVVAVEVDRRAAAAAAPEADEIARAIRAAVADAHEVQVHTVVVLRPGGILKTSSGKTQRLACRSAFLAGTLPAIATSVVDTFTAAAAALELSRERLLRMPRAERRDAVRGWLQRQLAAAARRDDGLDAETPLGAVGLDSLAAIEVCALVEQTLGVRLPLVRLIDGGTIGALGDELLRDIEPDAAGAPGLAPIVPSPRERYDPFPLSDIQQAYWIGRSAGLELGNISIHCYVELDGLGLDPARLERAWRRVVERHDMLRAVVLPDGSQRALESVPPYSIEVDDLQDAAADDRAARLKATRDRMSHQLFAADRWPSFEIRVSRLDADRVRVHVSLDLLHIDGGSLITVFRDWARFYGAPDAAVAPLTLRYRDYVLGMQALGDTPIYQQSLEYWRTRVATLPPAPALPLARTPASLTAPRFVRRRERIERREWERFGQHASARGLTPSAALLAAYAEILAAWSSACDLTINVTLFNRLPLHAEVDDIVGDFTSLVLLEASVASGVSFEARAARLQRRLWEDLAHRYVSGVQVLRELARLRHSASAVQMPVVFTSLLNLHHRGFEAAPTSLNALGEVGYSITQTPQVWLDHQVHEDDGDLVLVWDAVEDLFPPGLLDAMFAAYTRLVHALATDDSAWRAASHTHVPPEQLASRAAANATAADISGDTLRTLWMRSVAERPDTPAVVATGIELPYADLRDRAVRLARWLNARGVGRGTLVPVVAEKGWQQIAGCLAVHCAGAAYVPIDPHVPPDRLRHLLEDTNAIVALTTAALDGSLTWPAPLARLLVDDSQDVQGGERSELSPVAPSDLSHVIYTSGSTGVPKGVMIEHRSVVNRILDVNDRFDVRPDDRTLALTALHHDLSVYDVFGTLAAGGTIVVPDANRVRDPAHWAELMRRYGVTIWNSVPMFMEMLVEFLEHPSTPPETIPRTLRLVLLAGDWIPVTLPGRITALFPEARVIAAGGPTETTIWDICYPVSEVDPSWPSIPYGRPMTNARYHVLDDALEDKPVWVPGELYIGGVGLARGYWRDDEKTRSRFIVHPRTGERLYRSGDLGRYLPDGTIEFVGRSDCQVKIRGFRVELGEIESHLQRHSDVRAAVVAAVGEAHGPKRLVAYVVPRDATGITTASKRPSAGSADGGAQKTPAGVIVDASARLDFQLRQPGLRSDNGHSWVPLIPPPDDERILHGRRRTHRTFASAPIAFERFSRLLACLYGLRHETALLPKYRYPSAGSLYPVQTYVQVKPDRIDGLAAGLYYYHPVHHTLVVLDPDAAIDASVHFEHNRRAFDESAFSVFLVAQLAAIQPMYGQFARDFCLVEAGAMCQLLMTAAADLDVGLCPIGAIDFNAVKAFFDLDPTHELLHSLVGGPCWASDDAAGAATETHTAPRPDPGRRLEADLRQFLGERLPDHMVPSTFVWLDALPLSANGKVDRHALPAPETAAVGERRIEPRDDLERTLAAIVREVLELERVGVYDNLFDVGANSLHVIQIHNRLREAVGRDLSIAALFTHPTIVSLADYVRGEGQQP